MNLQLIQRFKSLSGEEHVLIAKICNSLNNNGDVNRSSALGSKKLNKKDLYESSSTPSAKLNPILKATTADDSEQQQQELENIIQDLEEENMFLMEEYNRLLSELASKNSNGHHHRNGSNNFKSSTLQSHKSKYNRYMNDSMADNNFTAMANSRAMSSSPTSQISTASPQPHNYSQRPNLGNSGYQYYSSLNNSSINGSSTTSSAMNRLNTLLTNSNSSANGFKSGVGVKKSTAYSAAKQDDSQIINEARLLRQHEDRLEARMRILENHNRLLDSQLKQLKGLLNVS